MTGHPHRADSPFLTLTPPRETGTMERGGHRLHWRDSGALDGMPMIFSHGGPGGASAEGITRLADARRLRIVQLDQRGCGRSEPAGGLSDNTLRHTIEDMEALRDLLGIERWIVAGASWGSTVSIAYAEAHPDRCLGLFLQGVWLARRQDTDWTFQQARALFPDLWEQAASAVPLAERGDLLRALCRRVLDPDPAVAADFAARLFAYEDGLMHLNPQAATVDPLRAAAYSRIYAHYAMNDWFLPGNQLLDHAGRIAHLPAMLVNGRYDCCTPPSIAYDLAAALPHAELRIVGGAGHYPTEDALPLAFIEALRAFTERLAARQGA